ncbi:MAG: caspase family protein [Rhodospirillaceae bacterium]|nr:caspase family protein [Rhodospirillaceae bacterium]
MAINKMAAMLALGLISLMTPTSASAEPRIALVIANAKYDGDLSPLGNPINDAKLIAKSLQAVGFDVIAVNDGSQKEMKRAIRDFGAALAKAGPTATGLFYFAGHGLQVEGVNYLVPVSAEIEKEADVDLESVAADTVLAQMEFSGAATSIVILDACRNNPLARSFRSATRGLARMDAPNGSFVAYSTAPGDVAADGDGKNSPFALALAAEMTKPGQAIEETFRNVRGQVMNATGKQQVPWDSSSMITPFYFAGHQTSSSETKVTAVAPAETPPPAASLPTPSAAPLAKAVEVPEETDFTSPLPDGTIVLSRKVKAELDAYLAKVATMDTAFGTYKYAFFYVSEDGRASGTFTCRVELADSGDCPKSDMNSGSTSQSRLRAQRSCEMKAGSKCIYLYRADEQKAPYKTLEQ